MAEPINPGGTYPAGLEPMTCGICGRTWDRAEPPPCALLNEQWPGQVVHTQAEIDAYESANPGVSRWVPA